MQKTRRLMDTNGVSFQMFLIQLSFTAVDSENQIRVDHIVIIQCQRNSQISWGGGGGGGD